MMPRFSARRIQRLLSQGDNALTVLEQGRALEDLICYMFERIPGLSITRRNQLNQFQSEEIDVAFWNDKDLRGLYFLPEIVLVECKNWSVPVGSMHVNWFDTKLRNRGLTSGILVAANGITGDANDKTSAHQIIATALGERRRLLILTRSDIEAATSSDQLVLMFKEKLCDLAVCGTLFA